MGRIVLEGPIGDALPLGGKAFGGLPVIGEEDAVYCNPPENSEGFHIWDPVSSQDQIYLWEMEYSEHYILVGNQFFQYDIFQGDKIV